MRYGIGFGLAAGLGAVLLLAAGCAKSATKAPEGLRFADDLAFLKSYTAVVVLQDASGQARVAVNPDLQGRVMTSTASGPDGLSFGWINREFIASGEINLHMNAFGAEDRVWLGPEGGQFSIFFKEKDPFDLAHWFTPPPVNTGAYDIVSQASDRIRFRKSMHLVNYSKAEFDLDLEREVRLLSPAEVQALGLTPAADAAVVAYASDNKITNTGTAAWTPETGLLSIWILGMFKPSPATTIVIPFKPGSEAEFGPIVNDAYFGKVPADRLVVRQDEGVLFFSGDGKYRSKIGIPPRRAKPFAGSYDAEHKVLTIIRFTMPAVPAGYVNSMWEIQTNPFAGDVVNSYNDGPPAPGAKPLGPFYELESSSPAAALKPGESTSHVHTTIHFQGPESALDGIARAALGVGLEEIKTALRKR